MNKGGTKGLVKIPVFYSPCCTAVCLLISLHCPYPSYASPVCPVPLDCSVSYPGVSVLHSVVKCILQLPRKRCHGSRVTRTFLSLTAMPRLASLPSRSTNKPPLRCKSPPSWSSRVAPSALDRFRRTLSPLVRSFLFSFSMDSFTSLLTYLSFL